MGSKKLAELYTFYYGNSWFRILDVNFKGLEPPVSKVPDLVSH